MYSVVIKTGVSGNKNIGLIENKIVGFTYYYQVFGKTQRNSESYNKINSPRYSQTNPLDKDEHSYVQAKRAALVMSASWPPCGIHQLLEKCV